MPAPPITQRELKEARDLQALVARMQFGLYEKLLDISKRARRGGAIEDGRYSWDKYARTIYR